MSTASPGRHNPYLVPGPAVVRYSGGRNCGYMLKHIVDAHGGRLPDEIAVLFTNTGMERTRLVDHRTASRSAEPYAALIERKGFAPNATLRYCTSFLKRDRIESYARYRLGLKRWHSVVRLRADEPGRVRRMRATNCGSRTGGHAALPLADARVAERDVLAWWKDQPIDLGLPGDAGNCTLCFLKGRGKLLHLIREEPALADWWIAQETKVSTHAGPEGRACKRRRPAPGGQVPQEGSRYGSAPRPTERAARFLAERGPEDRLDAFMMLTDQEYLCRMQGPERDSPRADFAEAVRRYEANTGMVLAR